MRLRLCPDNRDFSLPVATRGDMQYPLSNIWMNIFPGFALCRGWGTHIEKVNQTDAE